MGPFFLPFREIYKPYYERQGLRNEHGIELESNPVSLSFTKTT